MSSGDLWSHVLSLWYPCGVSVVSLSSCGLDACDSGIWRAQVRFGELRSRVLLESYLGIWGARWMSR